MGENFAVNCLLELHFSLQLLLSKQALFKKEQLKSQFSVNPFEGEDAILH